MTLHETFTGSAEQGRTVWTRLRRKCLIVPQVEMRCQLPSTLTGEVYFVTIAATSEWKILAPSVMPSSGSAARSG